MECGDGGGGQETRHKRTAHVQGVSILSKPPRVQDQDLAGSGAGMGVAMGTLMAGGGDKVHSSTFFGHGCSTLKTSK